MEYIRGGDLAQVVKRRMYPVSQAANREHASMRSYTSQLEARSPKGEYPTVEAAKPAC